MAIASVLVVHWWALRLPFGLGGYLGVDIFFVLSGYIITTMLWRSRAAGQSVGSRWRSFIYRRARRLYPALLGVLAGGIVIYALVPSSSLSVSQVAGAGLVSGLQLYPVWSDAPREPFLQNWSLAIEWYFYLLWPFGILTLQLRGIGAGTVAKIIGAVAFVVYGASLFLEAHWFYVSPPPRFAELLFGATVAMVLISADGKHPPYISPRKRAFLGPAAVGAIVFYVVFGPDAFDPLYRFIGVPVAVLATSYLIIAGAEATVDVTLRFLSLRPMAFIGRISYSFYLWHLMISSLVRKDDLDLPTFLMGALEVAATILLTLTSYVILERPFTRPRSDALMPPSVSQRNSVLRQ